MGCVIKKSNSRAHTIVCYLFYWVYLMTEGCGDGSVPALFFRLPPDHSTLSLIIKTSILVWSWSHSVRTLMRNMWSCPDTLSEETQSLVPSFSPSFLLPSPLFYSLLLTPPSLCSTFFKIRCCFNNSFF